MTVELDKYRRKLDGLKLARCRGRVVRVAGMTIESNGPPVGTGQLCEIRLADGRRVQAEVVGFHGPRRVLLPFEGIDGISPNDEVIASSSPRRVALGPKMLGRVLDGLCRPIDGKGPLEGEDRRPLDALPPSPLSRRAITEPLTLGV
ncbi:MAG: EscN/YscN/HrcN family type III secretion system ATPase, partial [Planctomycetota bacterium]|nr:EscN/YscN/HrcN family type III secretion system ATPase [Planctomycetota bacterium]